MFPRLFRSLTSCPIHTDSANTSHGLLYRSRVRTEPTNVTLPQWTSALWTRLESLMEEVAGGCIKVGISESVMSLGAKWCVGLTCASY